MVDSMSLNPGKALTEDSIGIVKFCSTSTTCSKTDSARMTITGKVISGNKAYFKELKAKIPATAITNQNAIVMRKCLIAHQERFFIHKNTKKPSFHNKRELLISKE